jgi:glycosyltransferase involved in cell wall biosynthesis
LYREIFTSKSTREGAVHAVNLAPGSWLTIDSRRSHPDVEPNREFSKTADADPLPPSDQTSLSNRKRHTHCEDRVRLIGALSHQETLRSIAAANLFVLPSRFEGFGIAAVEAMALGVPTITANFPASREYITGGITGHSFEIGDSSALADLIRWHLSNRDQSRRIGRAGMESVTEKFSAENCAELHQRLYEQSYRCETAVDQVCGGQGNRGAQSASGVSEQ